MIELKCSQEKNCILISVLDDGRGIDRDRLFQKAIQKKLLPKDLLENIIEEEKINLIFLPHFSTKEVVTDLSGRGIGLDIAKQNIEHIGGQLSVSSQPDLGTEFRLLIPIESSLSLMTLAKAV